MNYISIYPKRSEKKGTDVPLTEFLDGVILGRWQQHVEFVRAAIDNQAEYDKRKEQSPCAIIAGTFEGDKSAGSIKDFSGFMAVDMDDLDEEVEAIKAQLKLDKYTYAVFKSIGGRALCVIIKIDPAKWAETWEGVKTYYLATYGKMVDKGTGNVNRLRYVSYDPELFVNEKAAMFREYPRKKAKAAPKMGAFVHTGRDLDFILAQIRNKGVDLTADYNDWYRIGFALIDEYGNQARDYFHLVSENHPNYDEKQCEKVFNYLIRYGSRDIHIATFYYHCKQAGLDIMSPKTRDIVSVAAMSKKQHSTVESAADHLDKMYGIGPKESKPVIEQVFESKEAVDTEETIFDQLEMFLKTNFPLRRNQITRYIEDDTGEDIEESDFNSMWIAAAKTLGKEVTYVMVDKLIKSHFTPVYNPLKDFLAANAHRKPKGVIRRLAETIDSDTGLAAGPDFFPDYVEYFLRKWLIGLIEAIHGQHCPLVIVLTGGQNSGKTEWWRRLLPADLRRFYAETKFDQGKDDEILMCKKLVLMNDEFGGDTVRESKRFKGIASKQTFTLREPYGKSSVDLRRLALLCGTSNDEYVLNDPTGNRRIIPINVLSIHQGAYNEIDKTDVIMEAYHAYLDGERHTLTKKDIERLNDSTHRFNEITPERELVEMFYDIPQGGNEINKVLFSTTEIKAFIEKATQQRIGTKRLAMEMKAMGFPYAETGYYAAEKKMKRGFWVITKQQPL